MAVFECFSGNPLFSQMIKKVWCIIICYFSLSICYSQKTDTSNGKFQAFSPNQNSKIDSSTDLKIILFDSLRVTIYSHTRLRQNTFEQLKNYLDHSSIKFDNTNVLVLTTQMTDMKYYDPLINFLHLYNFHSIVSKRAPDTWDAMKPL